MQWNFTTYPSYLQKWTCILSRNTWSRFRFLWEFIYVWSLSVLICLWVFICECILFYFYTVYKKSFLFLFYVLILTTEQAQMMLKRIEKFITQERNIPSEKRTTDPERVYIIIEHELKILYMAERKL